jgi:hypothetical protein
MTSVQVTLTKFVVTFVLIPSGVLVVSAIASHAIADD